MCQSLAQGGKRCVAHSREGYRATSRLVSRLTGVDRSQVTRMLHDLRDEAGAADLPAPTQQQIDDWYADSLTLLDQSSLPAQAKDSIARDLMRARFEDTDGRDFHVQTMLMDRVRQQQVVATTPGIVGLAAPGSQAHLYQRDPDGRPTHVYYASYGSNLYLDRMNVYIQGGSPNGGKTVYEGARDKSPIIESVPVALPGTVHYAGHSTLWDGGVAFLDTANRGASLGRAHLITAGQFDDVVFAESNGNATPDGTPVDLNATIEQGRMVGKGLYSTLQHVGDHNGVPVVTFTSPFSTADALRGDMVITADGELAPAAGREELQARQAEAQVVEEAQAAIEGRPVKRTPADWPVFSAAPSPAYQAMIGGGLAETHGLDAGRVESYFIGATGYRHAAPVSQRAQDAQGAVVEVA
jgi:hypothetical protein